MGVDNYFESQYKKDLGLRGYTTDELKIELTKRKQLEANVGKFFNTFKQWELQLRQLLKDLDGEPSEALELVQEALDKVKQAHKVLTQNYRKRSRSKAIKENTVDNIAFTCNKCGTNGVMPGSECKYTPEYPYHTSYAERYE